MDVKKEMAIQHIRNAIWTEFALAILGLPIGYAISYFFQPGFLRALCSLGQYFASIKDVVTTKETAPTAIIVTVVVAAIMEMLGKWLASRARLSASEVLTKEEMLQYGGTGTGNGNIVFGKIKEGEDNPRGSIKRIVKMLFIGLGIIFLLMIALIFVLVAFSGKST